MFLSDDEQLALLMRVPLFARLNRSELEVVAAAARRQHVERDEFVFQQGSPASDICILRAGRVRVTQVTPDGNQVLLRFIHPGQMFGGVAAFGLAEYPASAQAIEPSQVWLWNGKTMRELMQRMPQLALNALDHTVETIQQLQTRVRELQTERVERRVARAVLRLARQSGKRVESGILIDLPLSRQDLAEMTGTNLYSVSRILSGWEKQGLLEAGRERVVLREPHRLVVIAEDLPESRPAASDSPS
ncbi:MAG TPA: Crp/Fnr family transcriptional regulator [Anaerolineae bacterium]|nr:Crp/Fnr family transcriptional regulator [Anaerolineae bacterium]